MGVPRELKSQREMDIYIYITFPSFLGFSLIPLTRFLSFCVFFSRQVLGSLAFIPGCHENEEQKKVAQQCQSKVPGLTFTLLCSCEKCLGKRKTFFEAKQDCVFFLTMKMLLSRMKWPVLRPPKVYGL